MVFASVLLTVTTIVYDEFVLAGHWIGKNACNIGGYASFELGATKVMSKSKQLHRSLFVSSFTDVQALTPAWTLLLDWQSFAALLSSLPQFKPKTSPM